MNNQAVPTYPEEAEKSIPCEELCDILSHKGVSVAEYNNYLRVKDALLEIAMKKCRRSNPSRDVLASLISERDSMRERLRRLGAYINSGEYPALSCEQQSLLRRQMKAMEEYRNCVVLRIGESLCHAYLAKEEKQNKEEEQA